MASRIIASGDAAPIPPSGAPSTFWKLSGTYLIAPESTTSDIGSDIGCLYKSLEEVIQSIIEASDSNSKPVRAVTALYLSQQIRGLWQEYEIRTARAVASAEGGAQ